MIKELWRVIAETGGARIYSLLVGMAVLALTARILGPEGRGVMAAVNSWAALFASITYLSLGEVALFRASNTEGTAWVAKTFGALLFLALVLSAITGLGAFELHRYSSGALFSGLAIPALLIGFIAVPFQIWEKYGSCLLLGIGRLRVYNRAQVAGKTAGLVAVLVMVGLLGWGVLGAIAAGVLGQIVISGGGFRILWERARKKWLIDRDEIFFLLKGGSKIHLAAIGLILLDQVDILMVNYYLSKEEVGWYQFAVQLVLVMLMLPHAASRALYSHMSEKGPDRIWPEQRTISFQVLGSMLAIAIIAFTVAPWAIPLVAGEKFRQSVILFRWLLLALLGMTLAGLMANQWIGRGLFLELGLLNLIVGASNILLNYLLIPRYRLLGAVWATVVTCGVMYIVANLGFAVWCDRRGAAYKPASA